MVVKNTISSSESASLNRFAKAYIRVKCPNPTPFVGKRTTDFERFFSMTSRSGSRAGVRPSRSRPSRKASHGKLIGSASNRQTERYGLAKPLTVTSKPLDFSLKGASLLLGRWPRHFHHVFALRNPSSPLGDEGLMHAQSAKRLTFTKGDSTPFTSRSSRVRDSTSALHGFGISSRPGSNADSHQPRSSFKRG
jgi:hypothetical protein